MKLPLEQYLSREPTEESVSELIDALVVRFEETGDKNKVNDLIGLYSKSPSHFYALITNKRWSEFIRSNIKDLTKRKKEENA